MRASTILPLKRLVGLRLVLLLAVSVFWLPSPSWANDSAGFQGTTGIELTTTDKVRMVSEDLLIALDRIEVSYVFRNVTTHDVQTLVVFPLPDLDLSLGLTAPNWAFPARAADFLDFSLRVDDRPVTPALERRAIYHGKDVTSTVMAAGALDMVPWKSQDYDQQARALSPTALADLRRAGLIKPGEYDATPQWVLRTRYFWPQLFTAGAAVRIRHIYKPFVGRALIGKAARIEGETVVGRIVGEPATTGNRYCLDQAARRALAEGQAHASFSAAEIKYILTTARNWRGPIGSFHLILDKGAADNIISLCWNGLRQTGPTTFESTLKDFVPAHDIRLLIFVRDR